MDVHVVEESPAALADYARVPIRFVVRGVLDVTRGAEGGWRLTPHALPVPYVKDYDTTGSAPLDWPRRFDLSTWGILAAMAGRQRVGGAVIAFDSTDVHLLEGRRDLALLWDLRVAPEARRSGVGEKLVNAVERWARARRCRALDVETQNTNVPACRFYERLGFTLRDARAGVYPGLPDEIQLLWRKPVAP